MVEIQFVANLKEAVGKEKVVIKAKKLSEALKQLSSEIPDVLDPEGKPSGNYIFLADGIDIRLYGDDPELKDDMKITIIPISHGG